VFVRWDNLRIEEDEGTRLPGYREPATVRHFDAPEALDTRFYEVRAKSALNKVPERSAMPFRWTVNPYRGCSHACVYCLGGNTPILLTDGSARAIADLKIGDEIYGTQVRGAYRRYVRTQVLAHWATIKPAYRIWLADGTELIASGDHRFLTDRGWKFVSGSEQGSARRPHLTLNNELLGTGRFVPGPVKNNDFRMGYLTGMVRGDGHVGSYVYQRPGRARDEQHRFRLALADGEALDRSREHLAGVGVTTQAFAFSPANGVHRAVDAIRTSSRANVTRVRDLIGWPTQPTDEWAKGFLSGIFDADGSCSQGVLRVTNSDPAILAWTLTSFQRFGFDSVLEPPVANGCRTVRVRGGLSERMRFFHLVDPSISRKRDIDGRALKTNSHLRVVSIEPLEQPMDLFDITTGTGDFIADGVVSHNCFARPTHTYLGFDAGRDFEKEIVVKVNVPEVLRAELRRPSWKREHVALGTNTDPYQWVESRYRLMPGIWEALRDAANPCSVLTKSPLVLRDLSLLQEIAARTSVTANLSVPTLDAKAWRASEPHTPHPRARLEAVAELNRAGIRTGVLVAPLMPGINDDPRQVDAILQAATEAGATGVGGAALHLRGEVRGVFMEWLRAYRPDLVEHYEALYRRGAYAPAAERERLIDLLTREGHAPAAPFRRGPAALRDLAPETDPRVEGVVEQPALF